jgi:hypothetical protein
MSKMSLNNQQAFDVPTTAHVDVSACLLGHSTSEASLDTQDAFDAATAAHVDFVGVQRQPGGASRAAERPS